MTASVTRPDRPPPSPLVIACLAATWVVWGSTYLAIKYAIAGLPPFFMLGTRFVVAGGVLLAFVRLRGAPWPSARQWMHAAVIGTLMLGAGMGATAHAELTIGSGLVVAFIAVAPLLTVLMGLPFGLRPRRGEVAGILVGLAGVLMLTRGSGFRASPAGLAQLLFATTGWTLGSMLSQRRLPLAPGASGFASEMLAGGVVLLVLALLSGERPTLEVSVTAWAAWAYLVVFGSLIAFNAYMYLLSHAPPALAMSYTYVNPVIALLLGVAIAGETVTRWEWLSAGVVLCGVVLLLANRR